MISPNEVANQLKRVGCNYTSWGSTEVAALPRLLLGDEVIAVAINGYYSGGFGLLVATNYRVLIIDRKPFTLNVEDLRYDMITEVNFGARFIIAQMHISIPTRTISFSSWAMDRLHRAMRYVQQHVLDAHNAQAGVGHGEILDLGHLGVPEGLRRDLASLVVSMSEAELAPTESVSPLLSQKSSTRGVNPYSRQVNALYRRRLPAFYH